MNTLPKRRDLLKTIKVIVLILLSIVFIVYTMGFMMYNGVSKTLLDKAYYRSVVSEYELSTTVHNVLKEMVPDIVLDGLTQGKEITNPQEKAVIDSQVELISNAITDALDKEWIEEQTVMVSDDLVGLLNGDKATLTAVIDLKGKLTEIKQNIATGLENYSDAELFAIFGAPRAYIPMISEQIVGQLGLPDSLIIADLVDDMAPGATGTATNYLKIVNTTFGFLAWVGIFVFLLLCILFWKVGKGLLWFGVTSIISGGAFLFIINFFSNLSTTQNLVGADLESLPLSSETLQEIIKFTVNKMNLTPILFIVGGIIFIILGALTLKARNKSA